MFRTAAERRSDQRSEAAIAPRALRARLHHALAEQRRAEADEQQDPSGLPADRGEVRFFFTMACVMAATIVGGFLFNLVTGRSSFALPLVVHLHAFVMMGWLAGGQGYLLATPAHVGGFAVGLVLQRPLLLWRYRRA